MRRLWLLALAFMLPMPGPSRAEPPAFRLQKPIACMIGQDCVIQQYPDHDPGPNAKDYRCSNETYDGHDGTDFRILDKVAQARGVGVIAAAAGIVRAVRDGQPDFDVGAFDKTKGVECGNGVLIDHGHGWQTQYCHLRRGSVGVKAGEQVLAGAPLGLVGQSGAAEFPHLHLTVRHDGKWLDPFADGAACAQGQSLWREQNSTELAYRDGDVLNAGFAAGAVTMDDIERGGITPPTRNSPALVVYVRALHLHAGDVQHIVVTGPDGRIVVDSAAPALDHDKAQTMVFAGKKRSGPDWPSGTYSATYTVTRSGRIPLSKTLSLRE